MKVLKKGVVINILKKETNSVSRHFCPALAVSLALCKVDPPPNCAPREKYYTAKRSTTIA